MGSRLPHSIADTCGSEFHYARYVAYDDRGQHRELESQRRLGKPSSSSLNWCLYDIVKADTPGTGDSFVTGDVLLEIETDKAQMDVEAQDEGKMAKIMVGISSISGLGSLY